MLSKYFIVFLLSFYSAQCSDITINVFDDDGVVKSSHSMGICVPFTCSLFCRNLGFTGGVCLRKNCTCGNFKPVKEDGEIKSSYSLGYCNPSTCDQLCRRMGFTGGVCIWGRCSCDNFKADKDIMNLFESVEKCNFAACDQLCRRLGFPGGACIGDRCKCDNFKQMTYVKDLFKKTGTCDYILCNLLCIRLKQHGGKCMKDHCICYNNIKNRKGIETVDENEVHKVEEEQHDVLLRGSLFRDPLVTIPDNCDSVRCDDICHRLNFTGGLCVGRDCQCF